MRLLIMVCFVLMAYGAIAQGSITITGSDMPQAGEIIPTATVSATGSKIDLSLTDTSYVWDFSKLAATTEGFDTVFDVKLISKYPKVPVTYLFTGFGGATYANRLNNGIKISTYSINNVYDMHGTSSVASTDWGFAGTVSGILPIPFKNTPLDTVYRFPLKYLNADSSYSVRDDSLTTLVSYYHRQKRYNKVDGWGKVITPYYDTVSALRVKSTIVGFDSITIHYLGTTIPFGFASTSYEYKWLSNTCHIPVMEVDAKDVAGTPVISGIKLKRHIWANGIKEPVDIHAMKLYPIPAQNNITVESDKGMWLEIFDINGKEVWKGNLLETTESINTRQWPAGEYIARFTYKGTTQSRSFIITH